MFCQLEVIASENSIVVQFVMPLYVSFRGLSRYDLVSPKMAHYHVLPFVKRHLGVKNCKDGKFLKTFLAVEWNDTCSKPFVKNLVMSCSPALLLFIQVIYMFYTGRKEKEI